MSAQKILVGVLAGVAAGAVLGILFAPDKGSNTRRKISQTGEDFMDDITEKLDAFLESAKETLANINEEAQDMLDKGKLASQDLNKEVKTALN